MSWNARSAESRIKAAIKEVDALAVVPFVDEKSLEGLSLTSACDVDGVHVYVDIPNAPALAGNDTEVDLKKSLRFFHVFSRVSRIVLAQTGAMKVDLQSTRLHFVVSRPVGNEHGRVQLAVAIAEVLRVALLTGNALHAELPDARIVIGIESGRSIAVKNGTRGDREPLFLGDPANHAAKLTGPKKAAGIYVAARARAALGTAYATADASTTPLTEPQIARCVDAVGLADAAHAVQQVWDDERRKSPLAEFVFSKWSPPLAGRDLEELSPANSRLQELVVLFADIDGFTRYVSAAITSGKAAEAVRLLHVLRKELRDVLVDFGGRKVRYLGDCVQGLVLEGTAHTTDRAAAIRTMTLVAAAMRSSFEIIQRELPSARDLGLQIGFELGNVAVSRVGTSGSRDRCVVGTAVFVAEREQARCSGTQTAIGETAAAEASPAIQKLFGSDRRVGLLGYDAVVLQLQRDEAPPRVASARPAPALPVGVPLVIKPRAHSR